MSYDILVKSIPVIVSGLKLTTAITLLSFLIGQLLALPIALARQSGVPILNVPALSYTFLVRGSPLLVQLFILYFGLAQIEWVRESAAWPILRNPVNCAILAIALNSAAYSAEILAGAIGQIPQGHWEACRTLGLPRLATLTSVILPQAYRNILPMLGNEIILVLKASSLASAVTVMEMTGAARSFVAQTYAPFEVFTVAGLAYLALGLTFSLVFRRIERRARLPGMVAQSA